MAKPNEHELKLSRARYDPASKQCQTHAEDLATYREELLSDPKVVLEAAEKLLRDAQVQAWVLHYWSRGDSDYSTMVTCTGDPVHYGEGEPLVGYTACKEVRRA